MNLFLRVYTQVEAAYLNLNVAVRYDEEDMPNDAPMRDGDIWKATIDLRTHTIENWPQGNSLDFYMKVCDEGTYELFDENRKLLKTISGYVPNSLLPGEYGDYLELKINEKGEITNWLSNANLGDFEDED